MKKELIQSLAATFETHAQRTESGVEYWLALDLQHPLDYKEWRNFNSSAISKAKTTCELSDHTVSDHFVDVNKAFAMPKTAEKVIDDLMLTRYACHLSARNGDPRKEAIAFAQTYFAIQPRQKAVAAHSPAPPRHANIFASTVGV